MSEGPSAGQDSRREKDPEAGLVAGAVAGAAAAEPEDDAYTWYQRGLELLSNRSPAAAAQLFERVADAEPRSRMVREALARAQFDAGWYSQAAESFRMIVEESPADDYAHFGLGLALARSGDPGGAAEYLALAAAMRPDLPHYSAALREVRATLRARGRPEAGGRPGVAGRPDPQAGPSGADGGPALQAGPSGGDGGS
ncbi:MAG TPA: tetratricopeptide repeat protein [Streptosporangiaceae bacterium]|jgi:tetratricopeptide (TPR) repeat protein